MQYPQCLLLAVLVLTPLDPGWAQAQERSAWFAGASFGPVLQDRQGNSQLRQSGVVVNARAGRRVGSALSALLTLTHTSVSRRYEVAQTLPASSHLSRIPCPDGRPEPCGQDPFVGPVKAMIAGAGFEASAGSARTRAFASLTPALYWLYERAPGTPPASAGLGVGAGGSVRLMEPVWLVLDLQYHQIFSSGTNPRWLVPVGVGIQVRE